MQVCLNADFDYALLHKKQMAKVVQGIQVNPGAGFYITDNVYTGLVPNPTQSQLEDIVAILDSNGDEAVREDVVPRRTGDSLTFAYDAGSGEQRVTDTTNACFLATDVKDPIYVMSSSGSMGTLQNKPLKVLRFISTSQVVVMNTDVNGNVVQVNASVTGDVISYIVRSIKVTRLLTGPAGTRVEQLTTPATVGTIVRIDLNNRIVCTGAGLDFTTLAIVGSKLAISGHGGTAPYNNNGNYRVSKIVDKTTLELVTDTFGPVILNPSGLPLGTFTLTPNGDFYYRPWVELNYSAPAGTYGVLYKTQSTFAAMTSDPSVLSSGPLRYQHNADDNVKEAIRRILGPNATSYTDIIYNDWTVNLQSLDYRMDEDHDGVGHHTNVRATNIGIGTPYFVPTSKLHIKASSSYESVIRLEGVGAGTYTHLEKDADKAFAITPVGGLTSDSPWAGARGFVLLGPVHTISSAQYYPRLIAYNEVDTYTNPAYSNFHIALTADSGRNDNVLWLEAYGSSAGVNINAGYSNFYLGGSIVASFTRSYIDLRLDPNGRVVIGNTTAPSVNGNHLEVINQRNDSNSTFGGRIGLSHWRSDGTAIGAGFLIGATYFGAPHGGSTTYNAANNLYSAGVLAFTSEIRSGANNLGTYLAFYTAPNATAAMGRQLGEVNSFPGLERMRIAASGEVGINCAPTGGYNLDVAGTIRSSVGGYQNESTQNWNFAQLVVRRRASNATTTRMVSFILDGDTWSDTSVYDHWAAFLYTAANPTTGSTSDSTTNFYLNGPGAFVLGTAGAERLKVDNIGRTLIYGNGTEQLRIGSGFSFHDGGEKDLCFNSYYDGAAWRAIATGYCFQIGTYPAANAYAGLRASVSTVAGQIPAFVEPFRWSSLYTYATTSMRVGGTTDPGRPLDVTGVVRSDNEFQSTMAGGLGQFRAIGGNYGILLRNDGSSFYILPTASGDQYGGWVNVPFAFDYLASPQTIRAPRFSDMDNGSRYMDLSQANPSIDAQGGMYLGRNTARTLLNGGQMEQCIIRTFSTNTGTFPTEIFRTTDWQLQKTAAGTFTLTSLSALQKTYWYQLGTAAAVEGINATNGTVITMGPTAAYTVRFVFSQPYNPKEYVQIVMQRYGTDYYWHGFIITSMNN